MKTITKSLIAFLALYYVVFFYTGYKMKDRSNFIAASTVSNNLKVEQYKVLSFGDYYSDYITDSSNFRQFIGSYHHNTETISYVYNGNDIYVTKFNIENNQRKLIATKVYELSSLKEKSNYNEKFSLRSVFF